MFLPPTVKTDVLGTTLFSIIFNLLCWKSLVLAWLLTPAWTVILWTGHLRLGVTGNYISENQICLRSSDTAEEGCCMCRYSGKSVYYNPSVQYGSQKTTSRHKIQERSIFVFLRARTGDICTTPDSEHKWNTPILFICPFTCIPQRMRKPISNEISKNHSQLQNIPHRWNRMILYHPCRCVNADWDYLCSQSTILPAHSHSESWLGPGNRNL